MNVCGKVRPGTLGYQRCERDHHESHPTQHVHRSQDGVTWADSDLCPRHGMWLRDGACEVCDFQRRWTDACPECRSSKCGNCDGTSWDMALDMRVVCPCADAGHAS